MCICRNIYFLYLVIGYTLTKRNELCSDIGYSAVLDLVTCEKAAKWLKQDFDKTFDANTWQNNWPQGCFLSGKVYFNRHSTGSRSYDARQICHAKGMVYTLHTKSIY